MRALLLSFLSALSLLCASAARAEDPVPEAYSRAIAEAVAEYETGNFSEARVLFEEAHGIYANARTLRGLGITAIELRMYVEAEASLRASLESTIRPLSTEQRAEVERLIARARRNIATVKLTLTPADAELQIGEARVSLTESGELLLNPGDYLLVASAPGHAPQKHVLHAVGGQTRNILVSLERDGGPTLSASKAAPATYASDSSRASDSSYATFIWIAAGASVALATTGVVLHALALGRAEEVERACPVEPERRCSAERVEQLIDASGVETLNTFTVVSFIASGAVLVTGGVLFALDMQEDERAVALHVSPLGASLQGSF
jgi:hypothetical protein